MKEACTLFVLSSQYVLFRNPVLAGFDPLVAGFEMGRGLVTQPSRPPNKILARTKCDNVKLMVGPRATGAVSQNGGTVAGLEPYNGISDTYPAS